MKKTIEKGKRHLSRDSGSGNVYNDDNVGYDNNEDDNDGMDYDSGIPLRYQYSRPETPCSDSEMGVKHRTRRSRHTSENPSAGTPSPEVFPVVLMLTARGIESKH